MKAIMDWIQSDLPNIYAKLLQGSALARKDSGKDSSRDGQAKTDDGGPLNKRETPNQHQGSILDRIHTRPESGGIPPPKTEAASGEKAEAGDKGKRDPSKTRCSFWPNCKNTQCPFVHPKENVR